MRLQATQTSSSLHSEVASFAQWILDIGNGDIQGFSFNNTTEENWIEIPQSFLVDLNLGITGMIYAIYKGLHEMGSAPDYLRDRGSLACRNDEVDDMNSQILLRHEGENKSYLSADTKVSLTDDGGRYDMLCTVEYLNSLKCSSVKKLGERVLEAEIITKHRLVSFNSQNNNGTSK